MIDIVNRGPWSSAGFFQGVLKSLHKRLTIRKFQYRNFNLSYLTEYTLVQHETLQTLIKYTEFH